MIHPSASADSIQRRITLLRHAEALPDMQHDDHARALSPHGLEVATRQAQWLQPPQAQPDLVLCSTATRTRQTLDALAFAAVPTILSPSLYLASASEMLALLQQLDDAVQHVLLVGHNPGMHGLAALLARDYASDAAADALAQGFPTAGLVSLQVTLAQWSALTPHSAEVLAVQFPHGV